MARKEILCVKKDTSDNITHVGGKNSYGALWEDTVIEVISGIESGVYEYYVVVNDKEVIVIVVEEENGYKHIRTTPDDSKSNNLDNLEKCP